MSVTVRYWRHYVEYTEEVESIEEAVNKLLWGEELGELSWVGVYVYGEPVVSADDGFLRLQEYAERIGVELP